MLKQPISNNFPFQILALDPSTRSNILHIGRNNNHIPLNTPACLSQKPLLKPLRRQINPLLQRLPRNPRHTQPDGPRYPASNRIFKSVNISSVIQIQIVRVEFVPEAFVLGAVE